MVKFFMDFPMCLLYRVRMRSPLLKDVILKNDLVSTITGGIMDRLLVLCMSHYFQCYEFNHDKASLTDGIYLAAIQKRGVVVNTR